MKNILCFCDVFCLNIVINYDFLYIQHNLRIYADLNSIKELPTVDAGGSNGNASSGRKSSHESFK